MQEEIEKDSIRAAVKFTKVTAEGMCRAIETISALKDSGAEPPMGEQKVKDLIGQGQGVSAIEISDSKLREFKKIANKYGVDFAIVKDKEAGISTVFFKGKDTDALTAIMAECTKKQLNRENSSEKEGILKKLEKYKEKVAKAPHKTRHKVKEQVR